MKQIAKKSLALLLAVCFMLTTAIVALPISVAAAATECDTWDEVVAAGATASIKLTADVTATSSIASFSGTFDGNGKTVTVSDTLFDVLADGATIKNLTIASASAIPATPLAGDANGTVTISDVTVNADVTSTSSSVGAFVGKTTAAATISFTNCVNNADISGNGNVAGFIDQLNAAATVTFTNCVNNGAIATSKASGHAAGFIACIDPTGAANVTFEGCANNGKITSTNTGKGEVAGFVTYLEASEASTITFKNCVSAGALENKSTNSDIKYSASGFMARAKNTATVSIENCLSIVPSFTVANNGAGFFWTSCESTGITFTGSNSYYLANEKVTALTDTETAAGGFTAVTADQLKSGEVAYKLGSAWGQKLGTDNVPVIGGAKVLFDGTNYSNETSASKIGESSVILEDVNDVLTATIEGPTTLKVGDTANIVVTYTITDENHLINAYGIGFTPANTDIVDFTENATFALSGHDDDFEDFTHTYGDAKYISQSVTKGRGALQVVVTFTITAKAAGSTAINFYDNADLKLFAYTSTDLTYEQFEPLNYTITVVEAESDEGGDTAPETGVSSVILKDVNDVLTATIEGPTALKVGDTANIVVTYTITKENHLINAYGIGFTPANTNIVDFTENATFALSGHDDDFEDFTHTYGDAKYISQSVTKGRGALQVVVTFTITAKAVGSTAINFYDNADLKLFAYTSTDLTYEQFEPLNYTITVVEAEGDTPDEPVVEENSTEHDATMGTGTLTVTGPATAVAGESFDVTFTWSGYDFVPTALDLQFFMNAITSQTQTGNIAVASIKSTNLTSYSADVFGYENNTNLFVIGITEMKGVGDTIEIVVTFTSTTPGYTGFSLKYSAISTVGTEYTDINYEDSPVEAYVIELTVPETSHTVIFKDGDTTLETATGVAYGSDLSNVYTAPAKEGYTFKGWTDADGKAVTTVTGDITVYANYSVNEYTVNITVKNGSATNATQKLNYAGSIDATVEAALAAAGLTPATGYTTSYTVSDPSVSGTTIAVTVTYSTLKTYTVTFKGQDGATLKTETVEHGKAATAPTAPAVEGYTFTGWDKDFSKVTGTLTVTAKYEINKYTVNFIGKDGSTIKTETVEHGKAATAPTAPVVEGYTFKNWDKAFDKVTGNLTVTAVYEINKYTVTFKGQDGATLKTETVEHGKAATAPTAPTVTGYTFSKWDKDFSKVTGALTVTAVYTINSYNVTVTVKSEGDFAKTTANYNTEYTLPTEAEVRAKGLLTTDDIFAGWNINGETYVAGAKVTITADTVITAILSNVKYFNVTIVDATTTTTPYAEGKTFNVPAAAGKTGYTFINWTDASGKVYTAGQTVTVTADITLTANYQINTYTVKFVDHDGTVLKTQTVNYGASATAPANPTRTGYTFSKWDKDFSNVTTNLEVKATYTINSYDIVITDHNGTVKTVKANYGANVLEVVNANYTKDASLVFVGFYNSNGTLISTTGKVTAKTLVYVAYTVEDIYAGGNSNIVIGDGIITYYAGADVDAFEYGTVAKNGGTGDTITFTAPLLVADAVASKISYAGETATYTIIVMGDVDGDADVDATDAALVADQMLDTTTLSGHYLTAANTTYPTALITARDIAAIKAFANGTIDCFAIPSGN